ncbi:MAG: long-chain-fatty-acid--CoA ligase [Deltaproteobacteria bacterium]|nr:long-chain-fatty-acid--CoA ligase [Deltaproteobacteria bacterium]
MILGNLARLNAARYGGRIAFKDERNEVSFDLANRRMNAIIRSLYDLGLKKGDRVAVLLYNCTEYCELLYGLPKGGFIMVPLNYRLVGRELKYILDNSESSAVIFDREFSETIEEIRPDLETVAHYICIDHGDGSKSAWPDYESMIENQSTGEMPVQADEFDIALLQYTSGTTGFPKGAMLTHRNVFTNLFNCVFERQPNTRDKLLILPPLYHCAAQSEMLVWSLYGCPSVMVKQFDPEAALEAIKTDRPNILLMVPAMQNMVINHPRIGDYDFSFVELMLYGASIMLKSHLIKSMDIFGCKFLQTAGLTEASPALTYLRPEDHVLDGPDRLVRKLGSAGTEAKLTEVKIVDPEGNECPPDVPGEELARGDNIMKGYWKMPDETAKIIVDGWLHTGDICLRDEDGYVYYVDRIKDMICRGAENVYPREIEEIIAAHPRVLEVAVIGVPDDRLQEEIMAVVALNEGPPIDEREMVDICEKNLARFKKPRYVTFVDELPKTASGKILKREIKKRYEQNPLPPRI